MDRKEEIVKIMLFDTCPWSRRTMDLTEFILLSIELWTICFAGWRVQSASPACEIKKQLALGPKKVIMEDKSQSLVGSNPS